MEVNSSSSLSSTKAHKINNNNNNRYTKIELIRSAADVDADAPANERTIIMLDTEMLTTGFDPLEGNEDDNNATTTSTTTRPSGSSSKELSRFDAMQHLIKGNLGPGCLNIPHAFALSGWVLGTVLFFLVAIQGIYSMVVLVYCKQWIVQHLKREQQEEEQQRPPSQHEQKPVRTFMDVAHFTHGRLGAISVQILLFVLQAGVCCVFLSLIATNLHASLPHWDAQWCLCVVTLALLVVVLLKDLKELKWLSVGANCLMVVAILTASVTALWTLEQDNDENNNPSLKWTKNPAAIATFVSSMFYSFEGIGLVMPVENSFVGKTEEEESSSSLSTALAREEEQRKKVASFVNPVLIGAMSIVGGLFLLIGTTCGPAFPDIHDGSVTAYLTMQFPDNRWYQIVNASVMVAVFLTFPLQLTPAMEVLEEWFGPGCDPLYCGGSQSHAMIIAQQDPRDEFLDEPSVESSTTVDPIRSMPLHTNACFGKHEWIFRRYMVVLGCAVVVLSVNDLGLLMSLFGALGNTGLAALPCVIHWRLMQLEIAPLSFGLMAMDLLTMMMSLSVAGAGVVFSVQEILAKNETD